MRRVFILPVSGVLFFAFSCGTENQSAETETADLPDTAKVTLDAPFLPGDTVISSTNIDSLMEGFPKIWVEVARKGADLVYTEYCRMDHPQVKIEKAGGRWEITTIYGFDAERWEVLDMMKSETRALGQQLVEGQFIVRKLSYPDKEIYHSSFFWNKTANTCGFGDFFAPDKLFADERLKKTFITEEEPCDL